jgi:replicative DNA helicase
VKEPPHALELEKAVLGALLLEKEAYHEVDELLKPESFYHPPHRDIYRAITDLADNQAPIDMLTVVEQLRRNGTLNSLRSPEGDAEGAYYIVRLSTRVNSASHIAYHARIIVQKALSRELIELSGDMQAQAQAEQRDIDDLMQEAETRLSAIARGAVRREAEQLDTLLAESLMRVEQAATRPDALSGLASGFADLDKITSGWQESDLIIIAARPAMGKTAFVLSMARNMVADHGVPIALFSLEMSSVQLTNRLIMNACNISGDKLKSGRLTPDEWERMAHGVRALFGLPLYIDDSPALSIFELRARARRLVRDKGIRMLIIDYLQLINAGSAKFGSREQEVSSISRALKCLAKELGIPIIALSQLNRAVETRIGDSKRPQLSDLRESGAIEQDADMVCFIHRPEYYKIYEDDAGNSLRGMAELIIAKHRNGAVADVRMQFEAELARFSPLRNL